MRTALAYLNNEAEENQFVPDSTGTAEAANVLAGLFGSAGPVDGFLASEVVHVLAALHPRAFSDYRDRPDLFVEAWNKEHELFSDPGAPLVLEESVYKPWTSDRSHPLHGATGLTRGGPAAHMEEVLRSVGFETSDLGSHAPDHLAVLLEFLAFLLQSGSKQDVRRFCADHLDWLQDLHTAAAHLADGKLVPSAVEAAEHLVTIVSR